MVSSNQTIPYMTLLNRTAIFEALINSPAYQNELVDQVNESQSTVYRGLKQLEDHNLVEKQEGMYVPTDFGEIIYTQYKRTEEIIQTLTESKRLFETVQDVGPILDPSVARDATILEVRNTRTDLVYQHLKKQISKATKIRGVVPTILPSIFEIYLNKTETGQLDASFVFGKEATELAQSRFKDKFRAVCNTGNFSAYSHSNEVPMGVVVIMEPIERVLIIVHDHIGVVLGIIDSNNNSAVRWGENWYFEHLDGSSALAFV